MKQKPVGAMKLESIFGRKLEELKHEGHNSSGKRTKLRNLKACSFLDLFTDTKQEGNAAKVANSTRDKS